MSMAKCTRTPNGRSSIFLGGDGFWHGWVTMGVKPDGSADRRHRRSRTQAMVTCKVRELEVKRDNGTPGSPGLVPTVEQWLRVWLETIAVRRVDCSTIRRTYRPKVERWIIPRLGHHRLDRLLPENLDAFYLGLAAEGLAANTVVQIHRILSRGLKVAVQREVIARNVCTLVDPPRGEEVEIEPLTAGEARAVLAVAAGRRNSTRWAVAVALGLRQGEVLGLRWRYVDLDKGEIRVDWQLKRRPFRHGCDDPHACGGHRHRYPCPQDCPKAKRTNGRRHVCRLVVCPKGCRKHGGKCMRFCEPGCTGHERSCPQRIGGWEFTRPKGSRRRTVPIPAHLIPLLRAQRAAQDAERTTAEGAWEAGWDLVWCQPSGRPIETHADWQEWKALLREAGIGKDARLHDARHTAGTLLAEQGVGLRVIKQILGHAQLSTTLRYTHATGLLTRQAVDGVGEALWGGRAHPIATRTATGKSNGAPRARTAG